jgi:hypothetical protein
MQTSAYRGGRSGFRWDRARAPRSCGKLRIWSARSLTVTGWRADVRHRPIVGGAGVSPAREGELLTPGRLHGSGELCHLGEIKAKPVTLGALDRRIQVGLVQASST